MQQRKEKDVATDTTDLRTADGSPKRENVTAEAAVAIDRTLRSDVDNAATETRFRAIVSAHNEERTHRRDTATVTQNNSDSSDNAGVWQ